MNPPQVVLTIFVTQIRTKLTYKTWETVIKYFSLKEVEPIKYFYL